MKTVSVTEFRSNIKRYLDIAQEEKLVIHRSKGSSFVVIPLDQENEETLLSDAQQKAIDAALVDVANGNVFSHKDALEKLKSKHPIYFK